MGPRPLGALRVCYQAGKNNDAATFFVSPVPYFGFLLGTAEYTGLEVRVGEDEFPRLGLGYTLGIGRTNDASSYRVGPCPLGALRVCYQARKNNDASSYRVGPLSPRSPFGANEK